MMFTCCREYLDPSAMEKYLGFGMDEVETLEPKTFKAFAWVKFEDATDEPRLCNVA